MTSQSTLAISGTWTSLLLLLSAVLQITLTLQNLTPLDQKIIVGKLRPMVYQLKTVKILHTVVVHDSYKVNEWNQTGVSQGFNWYCPDVRYNSWMRVSNAAGFTIDWLLKRYEPAGSSGVNPTSNPGIRDIEIDIGLQTIATLPDAEQTICNRLQWPQGTQPNTNLQLRYEMDSTLLNPTTDQNGQATVVLNSSRCSRYHSL